MHKSNYIYISDSEQQQIAEYRILVAGVGLGSKIAECAVRLGFKHFILIDGDRVEQSNLNRQHYCNNDIGRFKVLALRKHLIRINPEVHVECHNVFLDEKNMSTLVDNCDAVVNTIDYTSDVPFLLDNHCLQKDLPVLHPFNLGWAGCVCVVDKTSQSLLKITEDPDLFETKMVETIIEKQEQNGQNCQWLKEALQEYVHNHADKAPPQLAIASNYTAGITVDVLFRLANGKAVKKMPDMYFMKAG